jgi:hypothetical protein
VSWISLEDKYYLQKEGQDLRQKVDSAVNNFVQIHKGCQHLGQFTQLLTFRHFLQIKALAFPN